MYYPQVTDWEKGRGSKIPKILLTSFMDCYGWSSSPLPAVNTTFHATRRGDMAVTRRMAVEFCEDQAANGVAYTEARFSPHLMASEDGEVGAEEMLRAALEGFKEGEERFGTKVRRIDF